VNRGFSGYNTRWARIVLPKLLESVPKPLACVTLFFGANDSSSGGQNVPLEEYEENLKAMIQMVKATAPESLIVAITPPPVDDERTAPERTVEAVSRYAAVVRSLPVPVVVDLWGHIEAADLHDGLHLGPTGNRKVLALVQAALRAQPGLNPEDGPDGIPQMPMHFPHWSAMSGKTAEDAAAVLSEWSWP